MLPLALWRIIPQLNEPEGIVRFLTFKLPDQFVLPPELTMPTFTLPRGANVKVMDVIVEACAFTMNLNLRFVTLYPPEARQELLLKFAGTILLDTAAMAEFTITWTVVPIICELAVTNWTGRL